MFVTWFDSVRYRMGLMEFTMITRERLQELYLYNPDTGLFTLRVKRQRCQVGQIAGTFDRDGYVRILIDRKRYAAHRLAWLYMYDEWPNVIDHVDHVKHNNRLENLRNVTTADNAYNRSGPAINNKSGYLGVTYQNNRYRARIVRDGKLVHLGTFKSGEEASTVYEQHKKAGR